MLCVVPLALWLDYLRSIYLDAVLAGGEHVTQPLSGFLWKVKSIERAISSGALTAATRDDVLAFAAFLAQAIWLHLVDRDTAIGVSVGADRVFIPRA